jgi:hypothetical protein
MDGRRKAFWVGAIGAIGLVTASGVLAQPQDYRAGYTKLALLPDWSGVWSPGVSAASRATLTKPVLTPAAAKKLAEFEAGKARGENLQTEGANCVPSGMPGIMRLPYPIEFVFSPGRVNILIETYSQVRRIYTDGRALPTDPDPAFNGSSVGHWEGDTLVVDTIGISPNVNLVAGLKATEKSSIRERIRRVAPDRLTDEITITDPDLFALPYVMTQAYTRQPTWEMREYICQENNRDAADPFGRPTMNIEK